MNESQVYEEGDLLMKVLVAVEVDKRVALVDFALPADIEPDDAYSAIRGASRALAGCVELPETREHFGGRALKGSSFADWNLVEELESASHAFMFEVLKSTSNPHEFILDFELVVGDASDALPDLHAASTMLTRFVEQYS